MKNLFGGGAIFCEAFVLLVSAIVDAAEERHIAIESIASYDPQTSAFTVSRDVEVKQNETLHIGAGIRVYFAPLVGITVKGELVIDGAHDRPVVLSSKRGEQGIGAAYDWKGITVFPGGKADIQYGIITYASIGVKTCCDNVMLMNTVFLDNGVNFQIGDKRVFIVDRQPVSYQVSGVVMEKHGVGGVDYNTISRKTYLPARLWILSPIALGAMTMGTIYCVKWAKSVKEYNSFGPDDPRFADGYKREEVFEDMKSGVVVNAWLGSSLALAGLGLGVYVTIFTIRF